MILPTGDCHMTLLICGTGNGNKSLPEPMLSMIYDGISHH